jgi:hypothetical protein
MSCLRRLIVGLMMAIPLPAMAQDCIGKSCIGDPFAADEGCLGGGCVGEGCAGEGCSAGQGCGLLGGCGLFGGCGHDLGSLLVSDDKLLGLFVHSDQCFTNFISPMTNPVYFEDPRTLTEARFIFINHHLPANLGGQNVQVIAAQARVALTDKLSIIATKDGFITSQNPIVQDGFADVSAGLKYNIFRDVETQTIASVGTTFEMPVGSTRSLQGNGDGEFHLFATGGTEFLPYWHWVSGTGFRLPVDRSAENQIWYWSNHIDRQLGDSGLYLFTECNWYSYMSSGTAFPAPIGGDDLFNFGSPGMGGANFVSGAFGVKYKPSVNSELGLAYEFPYSQRKDIMKDRLTVDFIIRY